jgi:predicted HAD superfamily Cof-like phosphohydrolase
MQHEEYSPAARDLMAAMERGTLTMQEIAEAFAALSDDELEDLGQLLRKRHGAPLVPRSKTGT